MDQAHAIALIARELVQLVLALCNHPCRCQDISFDIRKETSRRRLRKEIHHSDESIKDLDNFAKVSPYFLVICLLHTALLYYQTLNILDRDPLGVEPLHSQADPATESEGNLRVCFPLCSRTSVSLFFIPRVFQVCEMMASRRSLQVQPDYGYGNAVLDASRR